MFTSDDDASSYFRRLARLRRGRQAARILRAAPAAGDVAPPTLQTAAALLGTSAAADKVEEQLAALNGIAESLAAEINHIDNELIVRYQDKRSAPQMEIRRMEKDIEKMNQRRTKINKEQTKNAKEQERVRNEIEICGRVAEAKASIEQLATDWRRMTAPGRAAR